MHLLIHFTVGVFLPSSILSVAIRAIALMMKGIEQQHNIIAKGSNIIKYIMVDILSESL